MLTPGERVLSVAETRAFESSAIRGGPVARTQGGPTQVFLESTVYLTSDDAKDPDRVLAAVVDGTQTNRRGFRTFLETLAVKAVQQAS